MGCSATNGDSYIPVEGLSLRLGGERSSDGIACVGGTELHAELDQAMYRTAMT